MRKFASLAKLYFKHIIPTVFGRKDYLVDVSSPKASFYVKPRTDHLFVLWETFICQDYSPTVPPGDINTVLDLGAHIGDFTIWVTKSYNPKKVIAVEPDIELYTLLNRNLKHNKCEKICTAYQKAVFSSNAMTSVKKGVTSALNSVVEDPAGNVEGITLSQIIEDSKVNTIDFFKMDIEGSEKHVLTEENEYIFKDRIAYASVEAHDLIGNNKEDAVEYFKKLGFKVTYEKVPWFFGILRIEAINPKLR